MSYNNENYHHSPEGQAVIKTISSVSEKMRTQNAKLHYIIECITKDLSEMITAHSSKDRFGVAKIKYTPEMNSLITRRKELLDLISSNDSYLKYVARETGYQTVGAKLISKEQTDMIKADAIKEFFAEQHSKHSEIA